MLDRSLPWRVVTQRILDLKSTTTRSLWNTSIFCSSLVISFPKLLGWFVTRISREGRFCHILSQYSLNSFSWWSFFSLSPIHRFFRYVMFQSFSPTTEIPVYGVILPSLTCFLGIRPMFLWRPLRFHVKVNSPFTTNEVPMFDVYVWRGNPSRPSCSVFISRHRFGPNFHFFCPLGECTLYLSSREHPSLSDFHEMSSHL